MPPESTLHRLTYFILTNWEFLTFILGLLAALIRQTRGRKILQATVDQLAHAVEIYDSPRLKLLVRALGGNAAPEVNQVIKDAAKRADPNKPNPTESLEQQILNLLPLSGPSPAQMIVVPTIPAKVNHKIEP